ncbi:hypothetical protein CHS0354_021238 [Potamilus streckersoni]|uniref:Uncharacterized protein n=1 Tax=Potamilus streckersoni TaxID=2493646 RepID=A0AAE0S440_9BIVA|nr:hypothetical protein CHS0354_021238 [Potamilus streckersoni]
MYRTLCFVGFVRYQHNSTVKIFLFICFVISTVISSEDSSTQEDLIDILHKKLITLEETFKTDIRLLRHAIQKESLARMELKKEFEKMRISSNVVNDTESIRNLDPSTDRKQRNYLEMSLNKLKRTITSEKMIRKELEAQTKLVLSELNEVQEAKNKTCSCDAVQKLFDTVQAETRVSLEMINVTLLAIKQWIHNTVGTTSTVLNKVCGTNMAAADVLQSRENHRGKVFGKPSFTSDWLVIKSQDRQYSFVTFSHNLGNIPVKVDVQIRSLAQEEQNWIFPGIGSAQADDDRGAAYGGAVYLYNKTHVLVWAPCRINDADTGKVLSSGGSEWLGPKIISSHIAEVRVRVWTENDFSSADYESGWIDVDVSNADKVYHELHHGLGAFPALVAPQIRLGNTGYVSDGFGSSMFVTGKEWDEWGGVLYGYNEKTVRIWVPFNPLANLTGCLFSQRDGWGNVFFFDKAQVNKGQIKVRAWRSSQCPTENPGIPLKEYIVSPGEGQKDFENNIDINRDIAFLSVEATSGVNNGYRFLGSGAPHNYYDNQPYGGAVYSYSKTGVRVWRPSDTSTNGYLVHIRNPMGNGKNIQASKNGKIIFQILLGMQ